MTEASYSSLYNMNMQENIENTEMGYETHKKDRQQFSIWIFDALWVTNGLLSASARVDACTVITMSEIKLSQGAPLCACEEYCQRVTMGLSSTTRGDEASL